MRVIWLVFIELFGVIGFVLGFAFVCFAVLTNKTVSGKGYLYPLIPFNGKALLHKVFRLPKREGKS